MIHKCGEETSPKSFSENSKLGNLWIKSLQNFHAICFYCMFKLRTTNKYWKEAVAHLLSPHIKLFEKTKIGLELISLPHFWYDFFRKLFVMLYSSNWPVFLFWLPLLLEKSIIVFLSSRLLLCGKKSQDKNLNILRTKRAFKIK